MRAHNGPDDGGHLRYTACCIGLSKADDYILVHRFAGGTRFFGSIQYSYFLTVLGIAAKNASVGKGRYKVI